MGFKALHGLEMAEIGLLGLTALGLIIAIASGQWLWAAIAFWLTLAINLFNRLRGQRFVRQQLRALKHQQRQLLDEKLNFSLLESASTPNDPSTTPSTRLSATPPTTPPTTAAVSDIQSLKLSVAHLEQSLAQVWQGLQRSMGGDRPQSPAVVPPGESIPLVAPSPAPDASEPKPLEPNSTVQKPKASPSLASPPSSPSQPLPEMGLLLRRINWQPDRSLENHLVRVSALSLSRDGRYLASGSWDQTLKVWELKTGQCLGTIHAHGQGIQAVAFAGNRTIVTGSYDQQIKIWSLTGQDSGEIEFYLDRTLTAHTGSVHALAVTADEKTLVSGSYDQTMKRWDLENAELGVSSYDPSGAIAALALDPKAQWIASAGGDGLVTLWPMNSSKQSASPKNDNAQNPSSKIMTLGGNLSSVESLAVSPDGQTLAAGCGDGTIKLWTIPDSAVLPTGQRRPSLTLVAHQGPVTGLCFTAAGYGLYSSGGEGRIKLWQPTQSEAILTLQFPRPEPSPRRGIFSLILTPDEQTLIAGGENGTIQTWTRE